MNSWEAVSRSDSQESSYLIISVCLMFHAISLAHSWGTNMWVAWIQLFGIINCFPSPTKFRLFYYELVKCFTFSATCLFLLHKLVSKASCGRHEFRSGNWFSNEPQRIAIGCLKWNRLCPVWIPFFQPVGLLSSAAVFRLAHAAPNERNEAELKRSLGIVF